MSRRPCWVLHAVSATVLGWNLLPDRLVAAPLTGGSCRPAASSVATFPAIDAAAAPRPLMPARPRTSTAPAPWVVNSTDDADDGACDASHCSLREAINAANVNPGADTIAFSIPGADPGCDGAGVCTIQPQELLPFVLDDATTIDGYTQPGASDADPRVLKIVVDGHNNNEFSGLAIRSANNLIRGLVIQRFTPFTGIDIGGTGATGNHVEGNFLGTDASGTQPRGNCTPPITCAALWFNDGAHGNVIGPGNLIAYNGIGVWITDPGTIGNTVTRNRIHDNALGGIQLLEGGNDELAAPVVAAATPTEISGSACANCLIEVFSDSADQGAIYEGMVVADGGGSWLFGKPAGLSGPNVTATATDALGNTSQFSAPVTLQPPTPTPSPAPPTPTATRTFTPSPSATPTGTATETRTRTTTPTASHSATATATPSDTSAATPSRTASRSPTHTANATASPTASGTGTGTATPTVSPTPSGTASVTASQSATTTAATATSTATATTPNPTPTQTATDHATMTESPTVTPGTAATATETRTPLTDCAGDCDGDGRVSVDELVRGVNIALGSLPLAVCPAFDRTGDGGVSIDELIAAVNNALLACPAVA